MLDLGRRGSRLERTRDVERVRPSSRRVESKRRNEIDDVPVVGCRGGELLATEGGRREGIVAFHPSLGDILPGVLVDDLDRQAWRERR